MRIRSTVGSLMLSLLLLACACTTPHSRRGNPELAEPAHLPAGSSQDLIELEQALDTALSQGDAFTLEQLLGDDYRGVSFEGKRRSKPQTLDVFRAQSTASRMKVAVDADEIDVKLFEDFAVLMGRGNYERAVGGYQAVRFVHVWRFHNDSWTLVASQESAVVR